MKEEAEIEETQAENLFKANIFANDPSLYQELFEKDERDDFDIEEIVPESPEEMQRLLNEMARSGVIDP